MGGVMQDCRSSLRCCALLASLLGLGSALAADPLERSGRLPPIDLVVEPAPATRLIPRSALEPEFLLARDPQEYRTPDDALAATVPSAAHLQAYKQSFFQKLTFTATQVLPDGSDGFGIFETELLAGFALPAPTTDTPLILIPTLEIDFPDEPTGVPLPEALYAAFFEFMWLPRFGPRTLGILAVAPGWYSDFQDGDDDAFRLTGRALLRYDWQPERVQVVLGAVYVDRLRSSWLPAGGVILTPSPDLNFELVFPRTKLARRLSWGPGFENWIYLTGSFGGNDWSIRQPDGSRDTLGLFDCRITAGWERKLDGGAGLLLEVGYVFFREIEFAATGVVREPDDTVLLRAGFAF